MISLPYPDDVRAEMLAYATLLARCGRKVEDNNATELCRQLGESLDGWAADARRYGLPFLATKLANFKKRVETAQSAEELVRPLRDTAALAYFLLTAQSQQDWLERAKSED
jgi:hypothetical protein